MSRRFTDGVVVYAKALAYAVALGFYNNCINISSLAYL